MVPEAFDDIGGVFIELLLDNNGWRHRSAYWVLVWLAAATVMLATFGLEAGVGEVGRLGLGLPDL